jgi:hypothetical protein
MRPEASRRGNELPVEWECCAQRLATTETAIHRLGLRPRSTQRRNESAKARNAEAASFIWLMSLHWARPNCT